MHHFQYKNDELFCESVSVAKIAEEVGTPFYLYSYATLKRHFEAFDNAFEGMDRLVCFSAKANTNLAILHLFANIGSGLDIVSGGELFRGLKAGFLPDKIVYSGVGKKIDEIDYAINSGILMFNVESMEELELIDSRAKSLNTKASISLRVNPNVDPQTHPYISTGLKKNKFGIESDAALEAYKAAMRMKNIKIIGIDCHIGSQITQLSPFEDALTKLKFLAATLRELGIVIKYLDMGGGLGITYSDESPPHPNEYAKALIKNLKETYLTLILEPGRVIVGNAGILVTQVLYRKSGQVKEFAIVDAAMNDLMRPTLYKAYHAIEPVKKLKKNTIKADVVGPICESGDFLALDRQIADVERGDLLAVMSAGAYGFTMSSNYCSRPRVAEVMVSKDRFEVIRRRETYEDLNKGETIPSWF
jgi:diaminopimelate decarboxylase